MINNTDSNRSVSFVGELLQFVSFVGELLRFVSFVGGLQQFGCLWFLLFMR